MAFSKFLQAFTLSRLANSRREKAIAAKISFQDGQSLIALIISNP
jgi:hypothetical protein